MMTQPPQINVSGSAEVKVAPDEIRLSVGVETRDQNLDAARQQNDERIARALAFLKAGGVPDKDVQTDFISVMPDYDYNSSRVKPVAYIVRKSIEIRVTAITNFEDIVTGLLTNGVNCIQGIDFRTSQLRKYRDQARELAIQAAKEKADAMASALGVKRGKVDNINVTTGAAGGADIRTVGERNGDSTARFKTSKMPPCQMRPVRTSPRKRSPWARSACPPASMSRF